MPFIPAAIAAIGSAIVTTVASVAILIPGVTVGMALAVGEFALTAISIAAQSLLIAGITALTKPKIQSNGNPIAFKADPNAGAPCIIGRTGVGGNIVAGLTSAGDNNKFLHYIVELSAGGPIDSIESFSANDTLVTFSAGVATSAPYAGKMWQVTQLGATTDAALTTPVGAGSVPEWGGDHKMTGHAAARWAMQYDTNVYPGGPPKPLWVVKGVKCYDPRLDSTYPGGSGSHRSNDETTWTWSDNPWIHALTFCIGRKSNGKRILGLAAPVASIDVPAFVEAANIADANGWTIGGQFSSKDNKWDVLGAMAQAGGGAITRLGSSISCVINTPRSSVATFTGADVVDAVSIPGTLKRRSRINSILFRYQSEAHGWDMVPADVVSVASYVAIDGDTRTQAADFPLVNDVNQAAQLATYAICDARELAPMSFVMKPSWAGIKAGDVITCDEPEYGLNGQDLLVVSRQRDPSSGAVTLTCRTETTAKHAFALGKTGGAPPTPTLTGIDRLTVPAPVGGQWTATGVTLTASGVSVPAIVVTGSASDNAGAQEVIVELKPHDADSWAVYSTDPASTTTRKEIFSVTNLTVYDVAISYRVQGVVGERLILSSITAGSFVASGASADVTPDAVNWANVSVTSSSPATVSNAAQTFTGIDAAITLEVTWTGTGVIKYSKNSGAWTSIATGGITVSVGDTLAFQASRTGSAGTSSGTVTVKNLSESPDTTLDTFDYSCTISASDVTPDAVNWASFSEYNPVYAVGSNANQTIAGISGSITLRFEDSQGGACDTYEYVKNGASSVSFVPGDTLSMSSGDTLHFIVGCVFTISGTISVYNDSDGGALLDTFNYDLSVF